MSSSTIPACTQPAQKMPREPRLPEAALAKAIKLALRDEDFFNTYLKPAEPV